MADAIKVTTELSLSDEAAALRLALETMLSGIPRSEARQIASDVLAQTPKSEAALAAWWQRMESEIYERPLS